ncbi:keratin, type II cytoskeletal 3-like [Pomacea canaliculata]|uniref:keratin, type II cytoskeletal 3-like n=1 Tax=Pomacea canaliculata TaxID=400727 RepID=UPI000D735D93|nr:keratin, type II cytoskeletal 3-like [Pomacea canaliculata]
MTNCSQISSLQLKNNSGPVYIKPELAKQIPQSNWKHAVKLELNSQGAIYCIKTEQVPGEELHDIKPEYDAHIEQSDCSHESAVKVEYRCQDVTSLIKTEQDPVQSAKTEEQLVFKKEEEDHSHVVKTETGWPGQHAMWQHDNDENFQEMNAATLAVPENTEADARAAVKDLSDKEQAMMETSDNLQKYLKDMEDEFRGLLDMNKIEGVVPKMKAVVVVLLCALVAVSQAGFISPGYGFGGYGYGIGGFGGLGGLGGFGGLYGVRGIGIGGIGLGGIGLGGIGLGGIGLGGIGIGGIGLGGIGGGFYRGFPYYKKYVY